MYVLIEEESYPLDLLESIFEDASFYTLNKSSEGVIKTVGYYYSDTKRTLVYMLPKVFMRDDGKTVFQLDKMQLANINFSDSDSFTFDNRYRWVRQLAIYFYNSLKEFKRRHFYTTLVNKSPHTLLNSNIPQHEYSYLDLVLTFVNFYQKNKNTILYRHIQSISKSSRKTSWDKTVRKQIPLVNSSNQPIYDRYLNKKKVVNYQEELIIYFFSILNKFNEEHGLNIKIDKSYTVVRGSAFEFLKRNGLSKLRKIKYRYFSDVYKTMYRLCELYFTNNDLGAKSYKNYEFITVDNYNIIFEDMIDKLFSDPISERIEGDSSLSLKDLKNHPDGKIIDHIYADKSLIDDSNIFYIGDSKYYKASGKADKGSQFKQFTYAKNVIQFHIDILNGGAELSRKLRYRDEITEGYNITPNFFIYAYIDGYDNFDDSLLEPKSDKPIKSSHFPDRLFDRDTLFVHEYQINFLYVLKLYTVSNNKKLSNFREESKQQFRKKFLDFFNKPKDLGFIVTEEVFDDIDHLKAHVDENFKNLNGRCISIKYKNKHKLLVAKLYRETDNIETEKKYIFK